MKIKTALLAIAAVSGLLSGCATKTYGRMGELTSFERDTTSCREIDLEISRAQGFLQQVSNESKFSGRDVLAFLGDFGIGNSMEKSAAVDSATKRMGDLQHLRAQRHCAAPTTASEGAQATQ
jgi:hypothetical protein